MVCWDPHNWKIVRELIGTVGQVFSKSKSLAKLPFPLNKQHLLMFGIRFTDIIQGHLDRAHQASESRLSAVECTPTHSPSGKGMRLTPNSSASSQQDLKIGRVPTAATILSVSQTGVLA